MSELTKKLIGTPDALDERAKQLDNFDKWISTIQRNARRNPICIDTLVKLHILNKMDRMGQLDKDGSIKVSIRAQAAQYPDIPVERNYKDLQTLLSSSMMNAKIEALTLYACSVMAKSPEHVLVIAYMLKWIHMSAGEDFEVSPLDVLRSFPKGIPVPDDLTTAWKISQMVDFTQVIECM